MLLNELEKFIVEIVRRELGKAMPESEARRAMISEARSEAARKSWEKRGAFKKDMPIADVRRELAPFNLIVRRLRTGATGNQWGTWIAYGAPGQEWKADTAAELIARVRAANLPHDERGTQQPQYDIQEYSGDASLPDIL